VSTWYRRAATVEFGLRAGLPAVAAGCLALVVAAAVPASAAAWSPLSPWAVAAAFWAAQLWHIGRRTGRAELGERPVRYLFGFANTLSLLRSGLYSVVAGLAVAAPNAAVAWLPGLCYGVGVVFDKLDGTVARTVGRETDLGERLDMTVDTAGFIAAPVVAVCWGLLPWWYLSLSAARYAFLGVRRWRQVSDRPVFERPDSDLGKYLAGVQMVFLTAVLLPAVPTDLGWRLAPVVLAPSLAVFGRDILAISGLYPLRSAVGDHSTEED
jgi:CDP-diacylglycerol--glycerol-3-phosphate 3-phosphatidyltransferase